MHLLNFWFFIPFKYLVLIVRKNSTYKYVPVPVLHVFNIMFELFLRIIILSILFNESETIWSNTDLDIPKCSKKKKLSV